jgi:hypothetical protein
MEMIATGIEGLVNGQRKNWIALCITSSCCEDYAHEQPTTYKGKEKADGLILLKFALSHTSPDMESVRFGHKANVINIYVTQYTIYNLIYNIVFYDRPLFLPPTTFLLSPSIPSITFSTFTMGASRRTSRSCQSQRCVQAQ